MKVHHADIVISAVAPKQYPETQSTRDCLGRSLKCREIFLYQYADRSKESRTYIR